VNIKLESITLYSNIKLEVFAIKQSKAELWMERIIECRKSGLCDFRWCEEHNIKPPTFYYWVKKLRIERSSSSHTQQPALSLRKTATPSVVPISVIEEPYENTYQDTKTNTAVIIQMNSITLQIQNNATQSVIQNTIQALRHLC